MKRLHNKSFAGSTQGSQPSLGDASPSCEVRPPETVRALVELENWSKRSEHWGRLMMEGQAGDSNAYAQLLRELDTWLGRYYARRLRYPAADDARQDALLAIHAKRHTYTPSRSFGHGSSPLRAIN